MRSDESGEHQFYLTRFPSGEGRWPVSTSGSVFFGFWSKTGDALYYVVGRALMRAVVTTTPQFGADPPTVVFEADGPLDGQNTGLQDIAPDGQRFLALLADDAAAASGVRSAQINVVLHWDQELTDRAPVP